ncbi:glycoside hydrolase family 6 protein [Streptomyces sp. HUAS TT20]|uniref:glycoside hydrolase family 6 protein n=1 Tax=Streptomyces sp. HUAS TT20 TaxID=3447509 RepID=UPI0021D84866|nr:glycoside hydrolase family 6 protein [Streptomyces sp. HUAS 15-9]UXY32513.1 glycoside hydrolase family 6 protein [Streptomyces sp. HUAS 15-9]
MVAVASAVTAVGTATGMISALDDGHGSDRARPGITRTTSRAPLPAVPSAAAPSTPTVSPSVKREPTRPEPSPTRSERRARTPVLPHRLYRHPDSQALDWVRSHPDDPRAALIASRIADEPAAVWFTDHAPATIASRVRAVTSAAAARGRVPVLVPYAIPDRDCGGASQGGAPDLAAYDAWIDAFAQGLGSGEVVVVLEPDSIAQSDCLPAADRADRFASLARAGRVLKAADPGARVYYDAGHSGWNPADRQADLLRQAGAASPASSDGVFSNVSNFRTTADEIAYDRQVLDALGGPAGLGAVIDTSRNGNGAPADGEWCDPAGRRLGRAPTLNTGERRIDAYLWVKPPGESDGCAAEAGTFTPSYAYELAR